MAKSPWGLDDLEIKQRKLKSELPRILANVNKTHFLDAFKRQAWGSKPWKKRKNDTTGRAILVKSGRLRRGFKTVRCDFSEVVVINTVPYSEIHNDGGIIAVKKHKRNIHFRLGKDGTSRFAKKKNANFQQKVTVDTYTIKMPQRRFMGNTPALQKKQEDAIIKAIDAIFK